MDIFTNQTEVVDNIRGSAENLGLDPNKVVQKTEKKNVLMAKKNCNLCYGRGVLTIAGHRERNTRKKEVFYKRLNENEPDPNKGLIYCKCVRQVVVEVPLQPA